MGGAEEARATSITTASFCAAIIDTATVHSVGQAKVIVGNARHWFGLPDSGLVVSEATCMMSKVPNGVGHLGYRRMNQVAAGVRRVRLDHIGDDHLHSADTRTPIN